MQEAKAIVQAYDAALAAGQSCALATVVQVQGSSYRRPGARMLVTQTGQMTGAISGGCLEGDALRKAALAIAQGKNKLVVYDTTDEEDAQIGIQLGCNGIVSILFEPLTEKQPPPIEALRNTLVSRDPQWVCTAFSATQSLHWGTMNLETLSKRMLDEDGQALLEASIAQQQSIHFEYRKDGLEQTILLDQVLPPILLWVIGAGNDALPLVQMADLLGWDCMVIDGRVTHANAQRFPNVGAIWVGKPATIMAKMQADLRTAAVLMTHNYQYDLAMLEALLPMNLSYIGLLGPAAKRERMLAEIAQRGQALQELDLEKLYGPTGLDLGAETAHQIALSICAEIMAVMHAKNPIHLKYKLSPIHSGL